MRKMLLWTALVGAALAFGTGCDDGGGSGGTGGGSGGAGGGSGGNGGSGGAGGSTEPAINGCTASSAEDHTADATTTVTQAANKYTPPCIKIKKGSSVKFEMDFTLHPLVGGEIVESTAEPDAASPIKETTSGSDVTFTFPDAGTYPYYCDVHFSIGMKGAVFVE